ncbi:RusA family crossover junction endodeoxyribonuclease [Petrachloros mirabilis]
MPIYRRRIKLAVSKLPIRLTPYRRIDSGTGSRRPKGSIAYPPHGLTASPLPAQTNASAFALSITLPIPPSINHQYATVNGRRLLSSEGRAYKARVSQLVWLNVTQSPNHSLLRSGLQSSTLALSIRFYFTSALRRDVDGGLKIAQDALCEGLGINDNRIIETHLYKHVDKTNPRIEVSLTTTAQS